MLILICPSTINATNTNTIISENENDNHSYEVEQAGSLPAGNFIFGKGDIEIYLYEHTQMHGIHVGNLWIYLRLKTKGQANVFLGDNEWNCTNGVFLWVFGARFTNIGSMNPEEDPGCFIGNCIFVIGRQI